MAYTSGRGRHDRLRAMRFVLWAQQQPLHVLNNHQVAGLLDISPSAASRWMRDYRRAISTEHIDGVPAFLTPRPKDMTERTP